MTRASRKGIAVQGAKGVSVYLEPGRAARAKEGPFESLRCGGESDNLSVIGRTRRTKVFGDAGPNVLSEQFGRYGCQFVRRFSQGLCVAELRVGVDVECREGVVSAVLVERVGRKSLCSEMAL